MIYDCLIIGAGPAGITAAIYLKRANLNIAVIEKDSPGGLMNKSSLIENYPGVKKTTGPDLAYKFYEQLNDYKVPYIQGEVTEIKDLGKTKIVKTNNQEFETKTVLLAVGRSPKKLDNLKETNGISFCSLCDGHLYKNEDVVIIGGGSSALEEALYLANICSKVTIIYRGKELKGDNSLIARVENKENISIMYEAEIKEAISENNRLEKVVLTNGKEVKTKACFIFIGYEPATKFLKTLDILDEKGYIITDEFGGTRISGIYAAGDIIKKEAYQIVTAASDGVIAATSIIKKLSLEE